MKQVTFSVHEYDKDGDIADAGIFLHFGGTKIRVAKNMKEFEAFIERLKTMPEEIRENYRGLE